MAWTPEDIEEMERRWKQYRARLKNDPAFRRAEERKLARLDRAFAPMQPPPGAQRYLSPGPPLPVYGRTGPDAVLYAEGDHPENWERDDEGNPTRRKAEQ